MTKISVGMACFSEFTEVWFTCQALHVYHHDWIKEIIVVDNNPNSQQGQRTRNFVEGWLSHVIPAKYVAFPSPQGTAAPRDHVFKVATGEAVMCMDCHVIMGEGSIQRLCEYYDANPDTPDLISGPMIYDNGGVATHFDDVWRSEMWGVWGSAWRLGDTLFSVHSDVKGKALACSLVPFHPIMLPGLPDCGYAGHEKVLEAAGFERLAMNVDDPPFEIPAMGLGVFSCRKDAWLGFNPLFSGFGGEEFYIHEKFRQHGAKCICLPGLPWHHLFRDDKVPTPYPNTTWKKIRNYVIGHAELGKPLDPVRGHFLNTKKIPQHEWDQLIADPLNPPEMPKQEKQAKDSSCAGCGNGEVKGTLEELYRAAAGNPSDINEHAPKLKELAAQAEHVTEFGHRPMVSTVALLAGQPRWFTTYGSDNSLKKLDAVKGKTAFLAVAGDSLTVEIEPTDLLFIDTKHTADQLWAELERHAPKVRKRIALHDSQVFGERGEDGGPGLLPALRRFTKAFPEWSVIYHTDANNGLTVISKDPEDKPPVPSTAKSIWTFGKALARMAKEKVKGHDLLVTEEVAEKRLDICALCPLRNDQRCSKCGCNIFEGPGGLPGKAMLKTESCPIGRWHFEGELVE